MNPTTSKPKENAQGSQVSGDAQLRPFGLPDLKAGGNTLPGKTPGFESNRDMLVAILTFGLIALTKPTGNANLRLHAYHSLFYAVVSLAGHGLLSMLYGVFGPFIPLYDLVCVGGFAFLILRAWQGRPTTFPILTEIARKQAGI
jgi:hypothetical protein